MKPDSLYTVADLIRLLRLPEQTLHERLHGLAAMADDDGVIWYRWCDVVRALNVEQTFEV